MERITVQPGGKDRRVPVENLKGTYFEQDVPREVYRTRYIERRLVVGDLVEVTPGGRATSAPAPAAKGE